MAGNGYDPELDKAGNVLNVTGSSLIDLVSASLPTIVMEYTFGVARALDNISHSPIRRIFRYVAWCASFVLFAITIAHAGLNARILKLTFDQSLGQEILMLADHLANIWTAGIAFAWCVIVILVILGVKTALHARRTEPRVCDLIGSYSFSKIMPESSTNNISRQISNSLLLVDFLTLIPITYFFAVMIIFWTVIKKGIILPSWLTTIVGSIVALWTVTSLLVVVSFTINKDDMWMVQVDSNVEGSDKVA
jgi:hypothetical protein